MARDTGELSEDDCSELLKFYMRGKQLGCGGQGQVFMIHNGRNTYAGKLFRSGSDAEREARLMSKLHACPGVVSFKGFVRERDGAKCYGTIVMELCGPNLCEGLINCGPMREEDALKTIKKLAETLKEIHSRGIIHRDLKPENILVKLNATGVHDVLIGDFGIATDLHREMSKYCGTEKYMAPEVMATKGRKGESQSFYTAAIDVWGLGVIAYELLRSYKSRMEIDFLRAGAFPTGFGSDQVEDLLQGMLAVELSKRVTLDRVLAHPWIMKHCSRSSKSETVTRSRCCGVKRSLPSGSDLIVKKARAA
ncbi:serine/threonine-protein kinase PEPKR2 [Selaginella moellendorffii]|uniref:serine/threonine-protein kinase PEPKR2 n=1 Tax=Selaginella moellendorffii TaxID=88036 RepID=UPI000D1CD031|nr:serine/threonine-protein kinase PEPKR2 [Selaginella moellendorffii]|eukprot:XP_024537228.1 serine/threonine-protein kinase PEPKR2 [Selaginella moellendorffii]